MVQRNPDDVRHGAARLIREPVRLSLAVSALGTVFLAVAAVWISTCSGDTADPVACGVPQRTALALGAPTIFLLGAVRAVVHTRHVWRRGRLWWAWQGSALALLALMLVALIVSLSALGGPVTG